MRGISVVGCSIRTLLHGVTVFILTLESGYSVRILLFADLDTECGLDATV
jgi:hypothetical protein